MALYLPKWKLHAKVLVYSFTFYTDNAANAYVVTIDAKHSNYLLNQLDIYLQHTII